jgi:UDP-N-acetylmuramate dehydrogenase
MLFSELLQHTIRENESLVPYTWLQMGGPARYFAEPSTIDELTQLISEANQAKLPIRLLGSGSNVLVREEGVDGLVIHMATAELCLINRDSHRLIARAGARLSHVISAAVGFGLGGLEHLAGIPGTVGAAVVTNAGGMNDDIGSRVTRVTAVDRSGRKQQMGVDGLQFGFRRSNVEDRFIVEVEFQLTPGDPVELTRRMQSNWIIRRATHPTIGSRTAQLFIEPDGVRLAEVLEAAGVRDAREGDFYLDPAHPGFVIATGNAKSDDLLALLSRIARAVEAKSGIQLQSTLKIW